MEGASASHNDSPLEAMSQLGFFDSPRRVLVNDASGQIVYERRMLAAEEAACAFEELRDTIAWRTERRMMYEREVDVPRLVSSMSLEDEAVPPMLADMRARVEARAGTRFNSAGFNLYRDGRDSVAPHNDTLRELAAGAPIALVSLGATRRMTIRSKASPRRAFDIDVEAGSLLIMSYQTQLTYDHAIPKTSDRVGPRISVAFRVRV
jgi:alkylated DNA repair dioxygenase AlkB